MSGLTKNQWMMALGVGGAVLVGGGAYLATKKSDDKPAPSAKADKVKKKNKDKAKEPRLVSFSGRAFGSTYTVRALPKDQASAKSLPNLARDTFGKIEAVFDKARTESEVAKLNAAKAGERVELGAEVLEVLTRVAEIHTLSGGAVDVTTGPVDALYADGKKPSTAVLAETKKKVGLAKLAFDAKDRSIKKSVDGVEIDFAALAPAYAVDQVAEVLEKAGVKSYQITVQSVTRAKGEQASKRPFVFSIPNPEPGARGSVFARVTVTEPLSMASFVEKPEAPPEKAEAPKIAAAKTGAAEPTVSALGAASRPIGIPDSLVDPRTLAPASSSTFALRAFGGSALETRLVALAGRRMSPEGALEMANKNKWPLLVFTKEGETISNKGSDAFDALKIQKVPTNLVPPPGASGPLPPGVVPPGTIPSAGSAVPGKSEPKK